MWWGGYWEKAMLKERLILEGNRHLYWCYLVVTILFLLGADCDNMALRLLHYVFRRK